MQHQELGHNLSFTYLLLTPLVARGKLCANILEHNFLDFLKTIFYFLSCIVFSSCPICRDSMNFGTYETHIATHTQYIYIMYTYIVRAVSDTASLLTEPS